MDRRRCLDRDTASGLAAVRDRFELPADLVYLDGNSLGPLQAVVADRLAAVVADEWGHGLVRSWNEAGWLELTARCAARIARIVGAGPHEVTVTDSTSVDLFGVLAALRPLRPGREIVLTHDDNFPTDRYVTEGVAATVGDLEVVVTPADRLAERVAEDVAVVLATHVDYRTGARLDAPALTAAAHEAGALMVWDLAHSAGAVPVDLHGWGADAAVGCTYKFLNGGPGAPGWLFVRSGLASRVAPPIRGWFGHARPFDFARAYEPAPGAARFRNGTPPLLSLAALEAALRVWDDVDPAAATDHAAGLTATFLEALEAVGVDLAVATPLDPDRRGAQVSLRHGAAGAVMRALVAAGVIGDHRPPDLLRFGFSPLFVRHVDAWDAAATLRRVLEERPWEHGRTPPRGPVP